mmetsp:Transcript_25381/g.74990  ORF Transcript_25381/g.74990 Transcript_25381/m.74990 type:complete len:235 (-) Transcript_25381:342-1046(-)
MKIRASSPRASRPYLTWLSMRNDGVVMPSSSATAAANEWLECRDSYDSIMRAADTSPPVATCSRDSGSDGLSLSWTLYAPKPLCARNRDPTASSPLRAMAVGPPSSSLMSPVGRLGPPSTPSCITPSCIMPRQMQYWRMPTKPRVPSIGSSTQCRPDGPPSESPSSISDTTSSVDSCVPGSSSATTELTSAVMRSSMARPSGAVSVVESSSATIDSRAGAQLFCSTHATSTWAP